MEILFAAAFVAYGWLALTDCLRRRLPNKWVLFIVFLYFAFSYLAGVPPEQVLRHIYVAVGTLAILSLLFSFGWIGGGDVKLWTAVMLWSGPSLAMSTLLSISISGALIALVSVVCKIILQHLPGTRKSAVLGMLSIDRGVPYGVALSFGGILVLLNLYGKHV